ncbi:hypothetical protein [Actinomadura coerulea]|uniref:hypothetical protein n=1 Tax=Actinomadura coerulea TaxID=46159 RepID=UPI0034479A07
MRQDELVGENTVGGADQPWLRGRFTAGPAFPHLEPLFREELALLDNLEKECERWEEVYRQIARQVRLIAPSGPVAEFLLHVQDEHAWFRWSDEPFSRSRRRCS